MSLVVDEVLQARSGLAALTHRARLALALVLGVATFAVHTNGEPVPRALDELHRDLRTGAATTVVVDRYWPASGQLTWATGPISWSRVTGVPKGEVYDPVTSRLDPARLEPLREGHLSRIAVSAWAGGGHATVRTGAGGFATPWAYAELGRLWAPLAPLGTPALALAALLMLAAPRRRYATRWAWFWIFLGGGGLAYVLLEPYPLWRGPGDLISPREPVGGAEGLLLGVLLALLPALSAL